jgi:electron transfer flavoprotein beta subunit
MKVLVAVKRVVDYNVAIRIKPDHSGIDTDSLKMSMNPFDEIAVEQAVQWKEQDFVQEVIAVSIGPKACQDTLRTAMAMGADRSVLVETDIQTQPLAVAKLLKAVIDTEQPDVILLGKQAIDDDANETGQMLAALLGWPQGTFVSEAEPCGTCIRVTREIDGGLETLDLPLPCIITTDLRLNEPRYATLPNLMKAKKKPIHVTTPDELQIDITPRLTVLKVEPPLPRAHGTIVSSVSELVDKLKNEAKVL